MTPTPTELAASINQNRGGFNEHIGLVFTSATRDEIVAELHLGPQHGQPHGIVHGGVYASIIETACSTGAALRAHDSGHTVVGLENQTSFLRATRDGVITVKALPVKTGKRSQVWRADVFDANDRMLATGQVRLLALEHGAEVAGDALGSGGAT